MKKAAIVLDRWKLPLFKKRLSEAGYAYTEVPGPHPDTVILKVQTESIAQLQPVVEKMNDEARRSKLN